MVRPAFPPLAACLALAALVPPAFSQEKKSSDGFIPLFNGKDLSGWALPNPSGKYVTVNAKTNDAGKVVAYVGKLADGKEDTCWRVEDGLLVGGGEMTHLYAKPEVEDFHLRVVVKVNDGGNSGIFFRAGMRQGVPRGFEAQVNATHKDPVKSGSLYPNAEFGMEKFRKENCVMNKAAHGPDEFFTEEIICEGPKVRILVNGQQTVDWTDPMDDPKRHFTKGYFAVQAHDPGSVMTFQTIEYKPLKK